MYTYKQNLLEAFISSGISINELSRKTDLSRNAIKAILFKDADSRISTFLMICDAIDASPSAIFSGSTCQMQKISKEDPKMEEMFLRLLDTVPDIRAEEAAYIFGISVTEAEDMIRKADEAFRKTGEK